MFRWFIILLMYLFIFCTASIPLDEFREINVSKHYGLNPDKEVLNMLDTVSKVKKVYFYIFSSNKFYYSGKGFLVILQINFFFFEKKR